MSAPVSASAAPASGSSGGARPFPAIPDTVGHGPRQAGFWSAYGYSVVHPNVAPQGANDFRCKPKDGQNPVVLLHGTFENGYNTWASFSPALKRAGYCVFAPYYGRTDFLDQGGMGVVLPSITGTGDIARSATQVGRYIDRVRKATGSEKVDVVAHSQGGLVARQWMKFHRGATLRAPEKNKIGKLITFGAPNRGTTLLGIAWIGRQMAKAGLDTTGFYAWLYGAGPIDQMVESPFINRLNHYIGTYPSVEYTIVGTRYEEVVTPYESTFLRAKGVENITLQDGCEQDTSDHLAMAYSPRAISIALRALDPQRYPKLVCTANPWFFSF
nr:alpha/beta fold hydrolase [Gordonia araii]